MAKLSKEPKKRISLSSLPDKLHPRTKAKAKKVIEEEMGKLHRSR